MTVDQRIADSCQQCGATFAPLDRFCTRCGHGRPTSLPAPPASPSTASAPTGMLASIESALQLVNRDPTGILGALVVLVTADLICAVGSAAWLGRPPLVIPAQLIAMLINPGNCSGYTTATPAMYLCSARVAGLTLVGPVSMFILLVLCHRWVGRCVAAIARKLPATAHFLVAPLAAAVVFACAWVPLHYQADDDSGLVSQRTFPAVVGCFTYASVRYGPQLQAILARRGFFERRDRVPKLALVALALAIPLALSLVATFQDRVSAPALKEQMVTLIALVTSYLAFTPRQGSLLSVVERATSARAARPEGLP